MLPTCLGVGDFTDIMQIRFSADNVTTQRQTHIQIFSFGGGFSSEAICNLCLVFKNHVVKRYTNITVTLQCLQPHLCNVHLNIDICSLNLITTSNILFFKCI